MFTRIKGLAVWNPSHRKMQTCIVVSLLFFPGCFRIVGIQVLTSYKRSSLDSSRIETKSFKELHTLWYVLLRERNVLATQREERRRLGIGSRVDGVLNAKRGFRVSFFEYLF